MVLYVVRAGGGAPVPLFAPEREVLVSRVFSWAADKDVLFYLTKPSYESPFVYRSTATIGQGTPKVTRQALPIDGESIRDATVAPQPQNGEAAIQTEDWKSGARTAWLVDIKGSPRRLLEDSKGVKYAALRLVGHRLIAAETRRSQASGGTQEGRPQVSVIEIDTRSGKRTVRLQVPADVEISDIYVSSRGEYLYWEDWKHLTVSRSPLSGWRPEVIYRVR
jgi:hypothetical protein